MFTYVIYSKKRYAFYGPQSCGYTQNPHLAGLYTQAWAQDLEARSEGQLTAYHFKDEFLRDKLQCLIQNSSASVRDALWVLTKEQRKELVSDILAELAADDKTYRNTPREYKDKNND